MTAIPPGYLVRYGATGLLGYFVPETPGQAYDRDARVVVRSDRGWEAGTILCPAEPHAFPAGLQAVPGTLLRTFESDDERRLADITRRADELFARARAALEALPVELLDVELVADPDAAIIHLLRLGPVNLDDVRATLADWPLDVRLEDATSPEAAEEFSSDCGDCGSGGGCSDKKDGAGCSGGTCGSGSGSKREFDNQWRAYFAELREKMHARLG